MTPHEQVTVTMFLAEGGDPAPLRKSPQWADAVAMATTFLQKHKAKTFVRLPLEHGHTVGSWIVVKEGIPYRCLYQWRPWPWLPTGWNGRVDVGYMK